MPELLPSLAACLLGRAPHGIRVREMACVGFMLYTLARGSEVLAADQVTMSGPASHPDLGSWLPSSTAALSVAKPEDHLSVPMPQNFSAPPPSDVLDYSPTEFRPRKHTLLDHDPAITDEGGAPMLKGTTVWQRLADYRAHNRVRLLTLWESGANTVSLQAGKRGDPYLQWTSHWMGRGPSRGEATKGVLDRLFSVSLSNAGETLRGARTHLMETQPPTKQSAGMAGLAAIK